MEEIPQPRRGTSAIRMLAAALAGAIGAFGVPAAARPEPAPLPTAATTTAVASDADAV